MSLSIYIHIPFCVKKCEYCDFVSGTPRAIPQKEYTASIIKEMARVSEKLFFQKATCNSIFFGGGTPSLFSPDNIARMIDEIRARYIVKDGAEITLEANPKTADYEKLKGFRSAGVNRLSIGVQSFNDNILKLLGRIHDKNEALAFYENAQKAGFENISLDIIFGAPTQTIDILNDDLGTLITLSPKHISAYNLTLEEGTLLFDKVASGKLTMPDDEIAADMFELVREKLTANGYNHYEISNYVKPGMESAHNMNYWRYGDYIGFGSAAHSLIKKSESALDMISGFHGAKMENHDASRLAVRWNNVEDYQDYMQKIERGGYAFDSAESLSDEKQKSEYLIMGLRMLSGIKNDDYFKSTYSADQSKISSLVERGLLEFKNNSLKLTKKGVLLLNEVLLDLI